MRVSKTLYALLAALLVTAGLNVAVAQSDMAGNEPVLEVGGEVVYTGAQFEEEFNRAIRVLALRQGMPFTEETRAMFERFRADFLNQLAMQEALIREAEARGITISDEDVQQQVDQARESLGGEEAFQQTLQDLGYADVAAYQEDLREGLLAQRVVDELRSDIQVTDEEVATFFEENREQFGDAALEDVRERIRAHVADMRFNERIAALQEQYAVATNPDALQVAGDQMGGGEVGVGGAGDDTGTQDAEDAGSQEGDATGTEDTGSEGTGGEGTGGDATGTEDTGSEGTEDAGESEGDGNEGGDSTY